MVYTCMKHKSFTCQNNMLKLAERLPLWLSIPLQMKDKNVTFQEEIFSTRFCFMIKQKYG